MNNDLISRGALLDQRPEYLNPNHIDAEKALFARGWNACNSEYYSILNKTSAVDAEPVRHGRWTFPWTSPECSACRKKQKWTSKFCPNCGAKMDAEVQHV